MNAYSLAVLLCCANTLTGCDPLDRLAATSPNHDPAVEEPQITLQFATIGEPTSQPKPVAIVEEPRPVEIAVAEPAPIIVPPQEIAPLPEPTPPIPPVLPVCLFNDAGFMVCV